MKKNNVDETVNQWCVDEGVFTNEDFGTLAVDEAAVEKKTPLALSGRPK